MLAVILASVLLDRPSTPVSFATETVLVDEIEVNTWGGECKQTQLIYKRFRYGRPVVIGWKIGTAAEILEDSSGYIVKHRQYLIRAETVRHSSTVKDMEREEFRRWGYGERIQELCGGW